MIWNHDGLLPILLLQAAVAFFYLGVPMLKTVFRWVNWKRPLFAEETTQSARFERAQARPYRGNFREAERCASQTHAAPPRPKPTNPVRDQHLRVLGLRDPAHLIDIKNAYRRMAKHYHPDRYASASNTKAQRNQAAAKMREVNIAYDWLCANA